MVILGLVLIVLGVLVLLGGAGELQPGLLGLGGALVIGGLLVRRLGARRRQGDR